MTNEQTAVVPVEVRAVASVFGTDDPMGIVRRTREIGAALGKAIKDGNMSTKIQGREYVLAEGWAYLGSMLGVFPRTVRVDAMNPDEEGDPQAYEAHVELVTRDGSVVGGAVAECSRIERTWSDRAPFALKSMSQTRATGKAYRMAFGYVMRAAGYEATPAEEMDSSGENQPARRTTKPPAQTIDAIDDDWMLGAGKFIARATEALALGENDILRLMECATRSELVERAQRDGGWNALAETLKGRAGPPNEVAAQRVEAAAS